MTDRMHVVKGCLWAGAAALLLAGCEDKPKETKTDNADAASASQGAVDPNLAKAVAAAGSKSHADAGAQAQGDGPPQTGIFEPGKADEQLKRGAPPKIALGDAGKEPRVSLGASVPPGFKQAGTLEISLKLGRAALPPIGVTLSVEAVKPTAPAAAPGAAPAPAPAADASAGTPMVAKISEVKLKSDIGADGRELAMQLAKMRGSRIDFKLVSGGVGIDYDYKLAKGAPAELDMVLRAVSEALESSTLGYPSEPVGEGGFWLVTTRGTVSGADVIAYRLVKLVKLDGDSLALSVNTKRYAASTKLELPGVPPGAEVDQFQSTADATLTAHKGAPIASSGTTKQSFVAALIPAAGGQQDQRLAVQSMAEVSITFGKK